MSWRGEAIGPCGVIAFGKSTEELLYGVSPRDTAILGIVLAWPFTGPLTAACLGHGELPDGTHEAGSGRPENVSAESEAVIPPQRRRLTAAASTSSTGELEYVRQRSGRRVVQLAKSVQQQISVGAENGVGPFAHSLPEDDRARHVEV